MKRLLLPMASLVALVVVACGGQGDPDTSATDGGAWAVLDTNRSEQDASVPMDVVAELCRLGAALRESGKAWMLSCVHILARSATATRLAGVRG